MEEKKNVKQSTTINQCDSVEKSNSKNKGRVG